MKSVIASVGYGDYLSWTLPYNRQHFERVVVVTTPEDELTARVAEHCGAEVIKTDVFTANGAQFAKYDGIELGLDHIGRDGWLTIMDADIMMPKSWSWCWLEEGKLFSPYRKMFPGCQPPSERLWRDYPRNSDAPPWHFIGYMQVFHASDPKLGPAPWHGAGHKTACCGDMAMMEKWPRSERVRLPYDVLHLGEARKNWNGRVTSQHAPKTLYGRPYPGMIGYSWCKPEELQKLIELLPETGMLLEIGSASGVTGSLIAKSKPRSRVVCIDPFAVCEDNDDMGTPLERVSQWRQNQNPNQHLWLGELDTFHRMCCARYDVILVDGDHQYTRVMPDLLHASTLLMPGGTIVAHDYEVPEAPQVTEAVNRFVDGSDFQIVERVGSLAIMRAT